MATYTPKFEIGQKVWQICSRYSYTRIQCSLCEGRKYLYDKEQRRYSCPKCNGNGTVASGDMKYEWYINDVPYIITRISIDMMGYNEITYSYDLETRDGEETDDLVEEKMLFASKKEAIAEVSRLTK